MTPDWVTVLALALLVAGGLSYLLVGSFPNDPALYQDSPVRGIAGSAFVICLPAAVVMAGVALRRSGWPVPVTGLLSRGPPWLGEWCSLPLCLQ